MLALKYYDDFAYGDYTDTADSREDSVAYANALVESLTGFPAHKHSGVSPEDYGW